MGTQKFRKDREKWGQMIERYFSDRPVLRGVISLVDGRHEPTELDCQMIDFCTTMICRFLSVQRKWTKYRAESGTGQRAKSGKNSL